LIDRKIDDDAASERDGYPGDQPTRADFCESPSADAVRGAAGQLPARIEEPRSYPRGRVGARRGSPRCRPSGCFLPYRHSRHPNSSAATPRL
jgi:hypothetical protein